ncbi:hypothetical protein EW026_g1067 [Hermanssonia centrifuga]|uniref:Uncharacterized protein n=1 Tax=Hermanssonia centrifuga TaxID=98765 RepID=A0A4S4KSM3_9APHY|nr:hypothetical protein EW026_g1067 [Hermanssonia centrifuga]
MQPSSRLFEDEESNVILETSGSASQYLPMATQKTNHTWPEGTSTTVWPTVLKNQVEMKKINTPKVIAGRKILESKSKPSSGRTLSSGGTRVTVTAVTRKISRPVSSASAATANQKQPKAINNSASAAESKSGKKGRTAKKPRKAASGTDKTGAHTAEQIVAVDATKPVKRPKSTGKK